MKPLTTKLFTMAYCAEWDGYDRKWHKAFARDKRELDELTKGAEQAAKEIEETNNPTEKILARESPRLH